MSTLYDDTDLYDLVAPRDLEMEQFYLEAAGGPGRQVLELACGSGRFTAPLARSGAIVTGIDLSPPMLEKARALLAIQGLEADLRLLDMRDLDLGRQFDAIVIAANSLMHLHTRDDFTRAFAAMKRHLAPDGLLAFDIYVPSAALLSQPAGQRQLLGRFPHDRLGEVTVEEIIAYDPITQVAHTDWYWSTMAQRDFRQTSLELRQIYPQELPLLLASSGLKLAERFGGFDRSPLTPHSFRQVCIATHA